MKNKDDKRQKETKISKKILLFFFVLFILTSLVSCKKPQNFQSETFFSLTITNLEILTLFSFNSASFNLSIILS